MKHPAKTLLLLVAIVYAAVPGIVHAQARESIASRGGKIRVALVPVDASNSKDVDAKNMIPAAFEDAMLKAGRFMTLSRSEMGAVRSEQRFAASGEVDPSSAVKLGKALSAQYVVVVRQLALDAKGGGFGRALNVGKVKTEYTLRLQAQTVDVETSQIVQSKSYEKKFETSKMTLDATKVKENSGDVAGPYRVALDEFAGDFTSELAAAVPLEAVVVAIRDANNVAINAGTDQGLRVGARFELTEEGKPIKGPDGSILSYDYKPLGTAEVVRVEAKLSWLKLTSTVGPDGTADSAPNVARVKQYAIAKMVAVAK